LAGPSLQADVRRLLGQIQLEPDQVDLVMDIGYHGASYPRFDSLRSLVPDIGQRRSLAVASGAFPPDLTQFKTPGTFTLRRLDWLAWLGEIQLGESQAKYRRRRLRKERDPFRKVVILLARTPCSAGRSVRTGNHYDIAIRVAHPALPVIRSAVAIRRISMPGHDDLHAHFSGALHDRVKVVYLEPQQYAVSVWLVITIADRAVMVFYFKAVQLKDKLAIRDQLLIFGAPMIAPAAQ